MKKKPENVWKDGEPCILGIDEAGRGPVLGPMVYAAAYCPKACIPDLKALGADDSKQLTEEQRETLRKKIDAAHFLRAKEHVISAEELSHKMLRKVKYNLNLISHDSALQLVEDVIAMGINVTEVYVDTVGNPESYASKFRNRFAHLDKVVVAKKADSTYKIVGAASIVAKTTRDRNVREWVFPERERSSVYALNAPNMSLQFSDPRGSGYPSDPRTKRWMEDNCDDIFGYPTFVRFSWGTAKVLMKKKAVQVDWESDDEDEEEQGKAQKKKSVKTKDIKSFFGAKPKASDGSSSKKQKTGQSSFPIPDVMQSMSIKRATTLI